MSSLAERIAHANAEAAARERAAYQEAQRKYQEKEAARLQAVAIATQQEEIRKAALVAELSPLLEVVGAKEQLEEVRKVWGVGIVDTQPKLEYNRLHLGIRFRFVDSEKVYGNWGEDLTVYHASSTVWEREASLVVAVGIHSYQEINPSISSSYGLSNISVIYGRMSGTYRDIVRSLSHAEPETIPIADPYKAKRILEDQLFKIIFSSPSPLELEREAREEINKDPLIPQQVKYRHYPGLRSSLPWYKRLLT